MAWFCFCRRQQLRQLQNCKTVEDVINECNFVILLNKPVPYIIYMQWNLRGFQLGSHINLNCSPRALEQGRRFGCRVFGTIEGRRSLLFRSKDKIYSLVVVQLVYKYNGSSADETKIQYIGGLSFEKSRSSSLAARRTKREEWPHRIMCHTAL